MLMLKGRSQIEIKMERNREVGVLDNARVILNPKREIKGFTIIRPITKEWAELFLRIDSNASSAIAMKSWVK